MKSLYNKTSKKLIIAIVLAVSLISLNAIADNFTAPPSRDFLLTYSGNTLSAIKAVTKPEVVNVSTTSITASGVTITADVTPNDFETYVYFQYSTDSNLQYPIGGGSTKTLAASTIKASVSLPLTTLTLIPNTPYYYKVTALSAAGTTESAIGNFKTLSVATQTQKLPEVSNIAATKITSSGVTITAEVTPNGYVTYVYFQYGTDSDLKYPIGGGTQKTLSSTASKTAVSLPLTSYQLSPTTPYYYRVIAFSAVGTTESAIGNFKTLATSTVTLKKPEISNVTATALTITGINVKADINPNGAETYVYFVYSTDASVTTHAAGGSSKTLLSSDPKTSVSLPLTNYKWLVANTTYYYKVFALSAMGVTESTIGTFKTPAITETGELRGKTLKDDNGNGTYDSGEKYIRDPSGSACTTDEYVLGNVWIYYDGPKTGIVSQNLCSTSTGNPIFSVPNLPVGTYTVSVLVPYGWEIIGSGTVTVEIKSGLETVQIFSIRQK